MQKYTKEYLREMAQILIDTADINFDAEVNCYSFTAGGIAALVLFPEGITEKLEVEDFGEEVHTYTVNTTCVSPNGDLIQEKVDANYMEFNEDENAYEFYLNDELVLLVRACMVISISRS